MYYLTGQMQGGGVAASWGVTKSWFCINAFWGNYFFAGVKW